MTASLRTIGEGCAVPGARRTSSAPRCDLREVLLRQLRRRFGALPASWIARVDKASAAELNRWADRVLTAESLAEVLGTKARRTA
jgi:hypothetical protein